MSSNSRAADPQRFLSTISGMFCFIVFIVFTFLAPSPSLFGQQVDKNGQESFTLDEIFAGELPQTLDDLRAFQEHVKELVKDLKPATVGIQMTQAQGSGVIISDDGYILTAAHVIGKPGLKCKVKLPDGRIVNAKTLGVNHPMDSGLLKITDEGTWPYLDMGESATVKKGQWVIAIGHPGGFDDLRGPVVRVGRYTGKSPDLRAMNTDCTLVGGDSGGPLFDMNGYIIGIHSKIGASIKQNMHVPIDTYGETWDKLEAGEEIGRTRSSSPVSRTKLGFRYRIISNDEIVKVTKVYEDSNAEKAGLKAGDEIESINGIKVKTRSEMNAAFNKAIGRDKGNKLRLSIVRDGKTKKIEFEVN